MAIRDAIARWLAGQTNVPNGWTVQPNMAQTGGVDYYIGSWTPGFAPPGVTTDLETTAFYGSTDPDSFIDVNNFGIPPAPVQVQGGGTPQTLANNAPNGGSC